MPQSSLFVDRDTGEIDFDEVSAEAVPIAKLVGLFVAIALVPLAFVFLVGGVSVVGVIFAAAAQFVLAVGAAVVLLYVIVRALKLADE